MKRYLRVLGQTWRRVYYQRLFTSCGRGFTPLGPLVIVNAGTIVVGSSLTIRSFSYQPVQVRVGPRALLQIGDGVFINQGVRISCSLSVTISDHCLIGDEVLILDSDWHGVGTEQTKTAPVVLAEGVWLASRVIVLRGVEIGKGSVVAAGSVVTRSIPPFTLAAGVPARPIRSLAQTR